MRNSRSIAFRNADVSVFRRVQGWVKTRAVVSSRCLATTGLHPHCSTSAMRSSPQYSQVISNTRLLTSRWKRPDLIPRTAKVESFFFTLAARSSQPLRLLNLSWWLQPWNAWSNRGMRYSDMAILLRARTRLKFYEESLRLKGIPFQTIGGRGSSEGRRFSICSTFSDSYIDPRTTSPWSGYFEVPSSACPTTTLLCSPRRRARASGRS